MDEYITRESLGRMAEVGYLYDARTDIFLSSCLRSKPPEESIKVMDSPHSDIKYITSNSLSDKLDKLNVKAELKLSVLAGLITLEGSGEYLKEEKRSAKTASASLIYSIRTKTEAFNLYFDGVKESISTSAIETSSATHIVTKIDWGANCIVEVQSHTDSVDNVLKAEGKLQAQLKKGLTMISGSVEGGGEASYRDDAKDETDSFTLRVFGDVLPDNEELPQKFRDAINLMKKLPSLVKQANNGKGKPLTYMLFSLASLQKIMKLDSVIDRTLHNLTALSIQKVLHLFQDIHAQKQALYDLWEEVNRKKKYLRETELKNILDHKSGLEMEEIDFREKLANTLKAVRSGKADSSCLDQLSKELLDSEYGPKNVEKCFKSCSDISEKVNFIETQIEKGMRYLTVNEFYDFTEKEHSAYIFYFGISTNRKEWSRQKRLAEGLLNVKKVDAECGMVDFDLMREEAQGSINNCCIEIYKDGSLQETVTEMSQMKEVVEKQKAEAEERKLIAAKAKNPFVAELLQRDIVPKVGKLRPATELVLLLLNVRPGEMRPEIVENDICRFIFIVKLCEILGTVLQPSDTILWIENDVFSPIFAVFCMLHVSGGSMILQHGIGTVNEQDLRNAIAKLYGFDLKTRMRAVAQDSDTPYNYGGQYRAIVLWDTRLLSWDPAPYISLLHSGGLLIYTEDDELYLSFKKSDTGDAERMSWSATLS